MGDLIDRPYKHDELFLGEVLMLRFIAKQLPTAVTIIVSIVIGSIITRMSMNNAPVNAPLQQQQEGTEQVTLTPSETIPPTTPLPTLTPSRTLLPPPTFEPATPTREATLTPTITPSATVQIGVVIPGLRGAETPTPTSTQGCTPRDDWTLEYEVQRDDALARIAERYGTSVQQIAEANCLTDVDVIVIGQHIRVPGAAHPAQQIYDCTWELLTPVDGTLAIEGEGEITFNWRGPQAPRNLIRIIAPTGSGQGNYEIVLELRQNEVLDLQDIPAAGTYTWYVYPLDQNFVQIPCKEGGPWTFTKKLSPPTETPTPTGQAAGN